ncbi:MAG: hypothetical protein AB9844_09330 [Clostridiaceae bacterium]
MSGAMNCYVRERTDELSNKLKINKEDIIMSEREILFYKLLVEFREKYTKNKTKSNTF